MAIETDPSYQAYLRAISLQQEQARADAARQRSSAEQNYNLRLPEVQYAGEVAREGIGESFEDRGLYGSGQQLEEQARNQRSQQHQEALLTQQRADQFGSIESGLARELAALEQQRAQQALMIAQQQMQQQAAMEAARIAAQSAAQYVAPPPAFQMPYFPQQPPPMYIPAVDSGWSSGSSGWQPYQPMPGHNPAQTPQPI